MNENQIETYRTFIDAMEAGDAITSEALFDKLMAEKLHTAIEDRRAEIAEQVFVDEELTLEDYSAEEIEAFMQTEEFAQLDELSKDTLKSYVKKSSKDAAAQGLKAGEQLKHNDLPSLNKFHKHLDKAAQRTRGIATAANKLAK